jgi:hypothetical protein
MHKGIPVRGQVAILRYLTYLCKLTSSSDTIGLRSWGNRRTALLHKQAGISSIDSVKSCRNRYSFSSLEAQHPTVPTLKSGMQYCYDASEIPVYMLG